MCDSNYTISVIKPECLPNGPWVGECCQNIPPEELETVITNFLLSHPLGTAVDCRRAARAILGIAKGRI